MRYIYQTIYWTSRVVNFEYKVVLTLLFNKASMDSKSQWEFTSIETLARQEMAKEQFSSQDQSDNSQSMSNDNDIGMEM